MPKTYGKRLEILIRLVLGKKNGLENTLFSKNGHFPKAIVWQNCQEPITENCQK